MRKAWIFIFAGILMSAVALLAQGPPPPPLSPKEIVDILKSKQQAPQAVAIVEQRGVNFELTPDIEKQLRKAKATDALIDAVKQQSPAARAERAAKTGSLIASQDEQNEMVAIEKELSPDAAIQMAAEFERKYPKSPLLTYVLALSAAQYEQKSDVLNTISQCEKSLALKEDNLMALLIIAHMLPQQQSIRVGNADVKLDRAENYATKAITVIGTLTAQPNETPEQFAARKSSYLQEMHSALGMVHFQRAMRGLAGVDPDELAKAEVEFGTAVTITATPSATDYYRLGEVREHLKRYDAAIEAYKHCSELDQGGALKTYAEKAIEGIRKAQGH